MRTNRSSALPRSGRFILLVLFSCAAIALSALALPRPANAQETAAKKYAVLPFDPAMKRDLNVPRILRGDDGWKISEKPELRKILEQYFNTYTFAEMTLPENVTRIPELRQLFFKKIWQAKDLEAYKNVNEIALSTMQTLVKPTNNFHPAVQYNAMLILSDLDVAPRVAGGRQEKPVAWPGALNTIMACATNSTFPDHVRAGGLVGLERQAEFGLTPDNRDRIATAAKAIILEKLPATGRSREVHDWMRRRACEVLGFAGVTGGDNNVPRLLIAAMNDPQATLAFRCSAAQALGKLSYEGGALQIDTNKLSAGMGDLALAVCNDTISKAKSVEENGTIDPSIADLLARQASLRLNQLKTGFVAPTAIGSPEDKSLAKDVSTQVEVALADLKLGKVTPAVLDSASHQIALRLGKAVAPVAKEAAPAATPTTPATEKEAPPAVAPEDPLNPF